jgi:hypothetical protein
MGQQTDLRYCNKYRRMLVIFGLVITAWPYAFAAESAPNLIAFIPPGVGLVAGIEARSRDSKRPQLFIPLPGKSVRDFDYINSLLGADPQKWVNEMIFVDDHLDRDQYDHTLLARGRFSSEILYKSALSQGAVQESYRGLAVLRVPPLARELPEFNELTWLAVVDSRVVFLGTPAYVRQEIDRLLSGSTPDPWWTDQFAAVQRSDVWWIMPRPGNMLLVRAAVMLLSPDLAELFAQPNHRVGMRYGKQAVFEYQVGVLANREQGSAPPLPAPERAEAGRFAMVSKGTASSHGVIKIPRDQYRRWVADLAARPISYK